MRQFDTGEVSHVGLEAARLHLARLIEEAARTRERHVLADDVEDGGVELHAIAEHVEPLAEFDLPARLRIQRRAVRLRLRQRPERVGERAVEVDVRAPAGTTRPTRPVNDSASRRSSGPSVSTPFVTGLLWLVRRKTSKRPPTIALTFGPSVRWSWA